MECDINLLAGKKRHQYVHIWIYALFYDKNRAYIIKSNGVDTSIMKGLGQT